MTLDPPLAAHLSGAEPFDGLDASVADFWRFAMSDLRTNNVRGYLAEFLVARAVGSGGARIEWDPWDVTAPDGTRIEVKSSGYLQAWAQKKLSRPTFQVSAAHGWDPMTAARSTGRAFNADATLTKVAGPPRSWAELKDAITVSGAPTRIVRSEGGGLVP